MKYYSERETKTRRTSKTLDFSRLFGSFTASTTDSVRRDAQGRLIVPLYSSFFSSITKNVMCSNVMFQAFMEEIKASLSVYSTEERVLLTVYESSDSADDDTRESVLVGFKKYAAQYLKRKSALLNRSFLSFMLLALFGVLIEYLTYNVFPGVLSEWICNLIDISATVLIWQFVAYMAFDFSQSLKSIRRLRQILQIEYVFRHWE